MYRCLAVEVMIASPGDLSDARDTVEETLQEWNNHRAEHQATVLMPLRWESRAVPLAGYDGGQEVINAQLLERADILFALFGSRAGTPTPASRSGTLEEIDKALERGLPVHIFFSRMPLASDVNVEQLREVRTLEAELRLRGLNGEFASLADLATKVRSAIEYDMRQVNSDAVPGFDSDASLFRVVGRAHSVTEGTLLVTNLSNAMCRGLMMRVVRGPRTSVNIMGGATPSDIAPGETVRHGVLGMCAAESLRVEVKWQEGSQQRSDEVDVIFAGALNPVGRS